jgi:AraC-like DNA-binding protein
MLTWSTEDVPERVRTAYWRDVLSDFGSTPEFKPLERPFHGSISAVQVGGATLIDLVTSTHQISRSAANVRRTPADSLCFYQARGGAYSVVNHRDEEFSTSTGSITFGYSDLPYKGRPTTDVGYFHRVVKIPLAACGALINHPGELAVRPFRSGSAAEALLFSYFDSFVLQAPHLRGAAADIAVSALAQLACVARGAASLSEEPARDAVRVARLEAARRFIDQNVRRPDLTPAFAARTLRMSLRYLHLLFEPTGTSFARYVMERRLHHACQLLSTPRSGSVAEVCFACGFESLATFYRNFARVYGMSPSEYRRSRSGSPDGC